MSAVAGRGEDVVVGACARPFLISFLLLRETETKVIGQEWGPGRRIGSFMSISRQGLIVILLLGRITKEKTKAVLFLKKRLYVFIFREGNGGGKRGREISMCGVSRLPPTGDWPATQACTLNWGSNQWPFGLQDCAQSTEPQQPEKKPPFDHCCTISHTAWVLVKWKKSNSVVFFILKSVFFLFGLKNFVCL